MVSPMRTWRSTLLALEKYLEAHSIAESRREAEILLCFVLNATMAEIMAHPERTLNHNQQLQLVELITRRVQNRIPIQYLVGTVPFLGLELLVDRSVLIPRPETEYLVEKVVAWCRCIGIDPRTIVDIGTGSGCIALALARAFPSSHVIGWDVSLEALTVARLNAVRNHVENVEFVQQDIFSIIPTGRYDMIVSNPPYISRTEYAELPPELHHEPAIALIDDDDGMRFYRRYVELFPKILAERGIFALECGVGQAAVVAQEFGEFLAVTTDYDFTGIERYIVGTHRSAGELLRAFSLQSPFINCSFDADFSNTKS